jgi:hypothetical protein
LGIGNRIESKISIISGDGEAKMDFLFVEGTQIDPVAVAFLRKNLARSQA